MVYMYADLAMAYLALSDLEKAYQHATSSLADTEKNVGHFNSGYALDALAQVEVAREDWLSATEHFRQAIDHYQQDENRHCVALVQRHFAEALFKQGERQQAIALLHTALTTFQELNLAHEIAAAQKLLDVSDGQGQEEVFQ